MFRNTVRGTLFFISLFLFLILAFRITKTKELKVDTVIFSFVEKIQHIPRDVMYYITMIGSPFILILCSLCIGLFVLFVKRNVFFSIFIMFVPIVGSLLNREIKNIYVRERPLINATVDGTGYSFPSEHATASILFFSCLIYFVSQSHWKTYLKWLSSLFLIAIVLFIGISRIYFHVHYPSDVIAGYAFGLAFFIFCLIVLENLFKRKT